MVELVGIEPTTSSLRTMMLAVPIRLIVFDLAPNLATLGTRLLEQ